jgi:hypothetical protein
LEKNMRSIDGIQIGNRPQAQMQGQAAAAIISAPVQRQIKSRPYKMTKPAKTNRRANIISRLYLPCILLGALAGGIIAAKSALLGQLVVVVYGISGLILRINSRVAFILALIFVLSTIVLLIGGGKVALAQNFATITFLLLVVGVITLSREIKREGGRIYSRKR